MRGRLVVIVLAALAVGVAAVVSLGGGGGSKGSSAGASTAAAGDLAVSFLYSPEKDALLKPLIAGFNASGRMIAGRHAFVQGQVANSGDVEARIAAGQLRPVMWSPSSSLWGRLLDYQTDGTLVAPTNPSIVRTPLVIAMWKELADAYGYPGRPLGFADLDRLATGGWAAVGKPTYGTFKFVHTNPDYSTSGLEDVVAQYYAAAGRLEGLTSAEVNSPRVRAKVKSLERSVVHYGDNTLFISSELAAHGLGYASAVAMEEATLIAYNQQAGSGKKLVAVYPSEGSFYSDDPLITLHGSWVTAEQQQAAAAFTSYVSQQITPEMAGRYGFRPASVTARPAGLVSAAYGADPAQPRRVLGLPEPKVLGEIKNLWHEDRRPANIMLVLDNSGSMGDSGKIDQARAGLKEFLRQTSPNDRVGLIKFASKITQLVPIAPMSSNRSALNSAIDHIFPEDQTRLYDAVGEAVTAVDGLKDISRINAVVLLTDGMDNQSSTSLDSLVASLQRQQQRESGQIRVFDIAYGTDADQTILRQIASASGGKEFTADPTNVRSAYLSISSFF
jgi:Ca-activated chloride channel family protein